MWGMKFNAEKCKVMHIDSRNPHYTYTVEGEEITVTDKKGMSRSMLTPH
jgi:hypothetical protein